MSSLYAFPDDDRRGWTRQSAWSHVRTGRARRRASRDRRAPEVCFGTSGAISKISHGRAVPTSVVRGPDGAYYVGTLTGFPFQPGSARVFRVVPGKAPTVYASGFTNIIDLAFGPDRKLYVLEIAHNGLLSGDPTGALIRVSRGGARKIVASAGLTAPGGLAIKGRSAYVSNCGTCVGTGSVVRTPLS